MPSSHLFTQRERQSPPSALRVFPPHSLPQSSRKIDTVTTEFDENHVNQTARLPGLPCKHDSFSFSKPRYHMHRAKLLLSQITPVRVYMRCVSEKAMERLRAGVNINLNQFAGQVSHSVALNCKSPSPCD